MFSYHQVGWNRPTLRHLLQEECSAGISALVAQIDTGRGETPLASALRLYALDAIGSGLTYDADTRLSGEGR